jgi:hypothetical protein
MVNSGRYGSSWNYESPRLTINRAPASNTGSSGDKRSRIQKNEERASLSEEDMDRQGQVWLEMLGIAVAIGWMTTQLIVARSDRPAFFLDFNATM